MIINFLDPRLSDLAAVQDYPAPALDMNLSVNFHRNIITLLALTNRLLSSCDTHAHTRVHPGVHADTLGNLAKKALNHLCVNKGLTFPCCSDSDYVCVCLNH